MGGDYFNISNWIAIGLGAAIFAIGWIYIANKRKEGKRIKGKFKLYHSQTFKPIRCKWMIDGEKKVNFFLLKNK